MHDLIDDEMKMVKPVHQEKADVNEFKRTIE